MLGKITFGTGSFMNILPGKKSHEGEVPFQSTSLHLTQIDVDTCTINPEYRNLPDGERKLVDSLVKILEGTKILKNMDDLDNIEQLIDDLTVEAYDNKGTLKDLNEDNREKIVSCTVKLCEDKKLLPFVTGPVMNLLMTMEPKIQDKVTLKLFQLYGEAMLKLRLHPNKREQALIQRTTAIVEEDDPVMAGNKG